MLKIRNWHVQQIYDTEERERFCVIKITGCSLNKFDEQIIVKHDLIMKHFFDKLDDFLNKNMVYCIFEKEQFFNLINKK